MKTDAILLGDNDFVFVLKGLLGTIDHESYQLGTSFNDGIPRDLTLVKYVIVNIKSTAKSSFLAKIDVLAAF